MHACQSPFVLFSSQTSVTFLVAFFVVTFFVAAVASRMRITCESHANYMRVAYE